MPLRHKRPPQKLVDEAERYPEYSRRDFGVGYYEIWYLDEDGGVLHYVAYEAAPDFDIENPGGPVKYGSTFYPTNDRHTLPDWMRRILDQDAEDRFEAAAFLDDCRRGR